MSSNGEWRMRWNDNGSRFDVTVHGTITFADDLTDVQTLSDGGSMMIRDWSGVVPHTVEIKASGGRITREYFVGGISRGWTDEGRRFLAEQLPAIVRRSGIGAESRVKSIFAKKGAGGVLEEIDLVASDYARRLYLVALIHLARFDSSSVAPVLQRVSQQMRSDYDRRQVLEHVASHVKLDRRGAEAYVRTMGSMRSDYDQRLALDALTKSGAELDGDAAFQAVSRMRSSYDKRLVLTEIINRGGLSADTKRALLKSAADLSSDYDRRLVLTEYLKKLDLDASARDAFFAAVDAMRSDYDRAETLLAFAGHHAIDGPIRASFVSSAERIRSSYDQNRVLAALAKSARR
jgi:hypothetical protein